MEEKENKEFIPNELLSQENPSSTIHIQDDSESAAAPQNRVNPQHGAVSTASLSTNYGWSHDIPIENSAETIKANQNLKIKDCLPPFEEAAFEPSAPPLSSHGIGKTNDSPSINANEIETGDIPFENNIETLKANQNLDTTDCLPSFKEATVEPSAPPLSPNGNGETIDVPSHNANEIVSGFTPNLINDIQENIPSGNRNGNKIFNHTLKEISLGLNLIKAAKRLITFLKLVDGEGDLYSGKKVKAAIYRYEHFWLPLIAQQSEVTLSPPLDIHWIWVVHMLSPLHYEKDCLQIVGKVIPHRLMTLSALNRSCEFGRAAWEQHYPHMEWHLTMDTAFQISAFSEKSCISYNLEDAVARQSAFFYQVSLEHYASKAFLCKSVNRYKQFLALKKAHPDKFLVPCYDIDIIWHAHQLHPVIYKQMTTNFLGQLLPHDDSVNNRSQDSKLNISDAATRDMWLAAFGTTFRRNGAMFRGDPPATYLNPAPKTALNAAHLSKFHISIIKVKIEGHFPSGPLRAKLKQENQRLANFTFFHSGSAISEHNVTEMNLDFVVSERALKSWTVLKISSDKKIGKFLKFLGKGTFWCMTNLVELFPIKEEDTVTKVFQDDESSCVVELELKVRREVTSGWVPLGIMTGGFMPCVLSPETLTALFGMVTSSKSGNQDIYLAEMATHRLKHIYQCAEDYLAVTVTILTNGN